MDLYFLIITLSEMGNIYKIMTKHRGKALYEKLYESNTQNYI